MISVIKESDSDSGDGREFRLRDDEWTAPVSGITEEAERTSKGAAVGCMIAHREQAKQSPMLREEVQRKPRV